MKQPRIAKRHPIADWPLIIAVLALTSSLLFLLYVTLTFGRSEPTRLKPLETMIKKNA